MPERDALLAYGENSENCPHPRDAERVSLPTKKRIEQKAHYPNCPCTGVMVAFVSAGKKLAGLF